MSEHAIALVTPAEGSAPIVTSDQLALVKRTIAAGATDAELKLFLFDCARQGVHPLDRLIHFTKRGGKYTPVTSIDFMRIRAADTTEYAGSDDPVFRYGDVTDQPVSGQPPDKATVTVWRLVQGQRYAFTATARWDEYKPEQNDFMWRRMPHTMLGKCAEALALRKGFPRQLAGLYTTDEMAQAGPAQKGPSVEPEVAENSPGAPPVAPQGVNRDTGEVTETPVGSAAQAGFHYLDAAMLDSDGFYVLAWQRETYRTKIKRVGEVALLAFKDTQRVKLSGKPWVSKVDVEPVL